MKKNLLSEGVEFFFTERFCQDEIEEYFGNQRQLGRRSYNHDLQMSGYDDNAIRIQKMHIVLVIIQEGDMTKEKTG